MKRIDENARIRLGGVSLPHDALQAECAGVSEHALSVMCSEKISTGPAVRMSFATLRTRRRHVCLSPGGSPRWVEPWP